MFSRNTISVVFSESTFDPQVQTADTVSCSGGVSVRLLLCSHYENETQARIDDHYDSFCNAMLSLLPAAS
jgi:hypothetical protein